jgi:hypothetical protein
MAERKWNWDLFEGKTEEKTTADGEVNQAEVEKLTELVNRAIPLIEQVNSLYNQYRNGAEKRAPLERRSQLDQVIQSIQLMRKPTESQRFQVRQIVSKYLSYKDRWDRMLRAMETGNDPYHRPVRKVASKKKPA